MCLETSLRMRRDDTRIISLVFIVQNSVARTIFVTCGYFGLPWPRASSSRLRKKTTTFQDYKKTVDCFPPAINAFVFLGLPAGAGKTSRGLLPGRQDCWAGWVRGTTSRTNPMRVHVTLEQTEKGQHKFWATQIKKLTIMGSRFVELVILRISMFSVLQNARIPDF